MIGTESVGTWKDAEAIKLVKEIADSYWYEDGYCRYCGRQDGRGDVVEHREDCFWQRAKRLAEIGL